MQNFKLIKEPREHFATFWKERKQDGEERLLELQDELRHIATHVNEGSDLARCATIELLAPRDEPSADNTDGQTNRKVPGIYWVVSGDLLEVALIACEMVKQQLENECVSQEAELERLSHLSAEQIYANQFD